jgi:seryl-tRNA synthetase
MSTLGKILVYVALVGAVVAGVFAGLLIFGPKGFNETKVNLAQSQATVAADDNTIKKDKAEYTALKATNDQNVSDLTDAKKKVDDLTTQATSLQKAADDAKAALTDAQAKQKDAEDKLAADTAALGGKTPQEYKDAEAKAESDSQAAQAELKIVQDQLDQDKTQIASLQNSLQRMPTGSQPPGISGKVTFVDNAWNFGILDVGQANGVVPNGELIVYRNNAFLGKVKVTKVDTNDAVAEILPDVKGSIQVGDKVLN